MTTASLDPSSEVPVFLYCWLPGGNQNEFADLDAEMVLRGVAVEFSALRDGGRIYRVPECDLQKLPIDESGPYFGDEDSGHALSRRDPANVDANRIEFDGTAWEKVLRHIEGPIIGR